jgi:hypothetical protein
MDVLIYSIARLGKALLGALAYPTLFFSLIAFIITTIRTFYLLRHSLFQLFYIFVYNDCL